MKRKYILFVLCVVMCLCLVACAKPEHSTSLETKITFDVSEKILNAGENFTLSYRVINSEENLVWSSSNEKVAIVNEGKVTGVYDGSATITATVGTGEGAKSASCVVTVINGGSAPIMVVDYESLNISPEDSFNVPVSIIFNGEKVNADITLTSNNESVATVVKNTIGANIKGVAIGVAKIMVQANYAGITLAKEISVSVKEDIVLEFENDKIEFIGGNYNLNLDRADITKTPFVASEEDLGVKVSVNGSEITATTVIYSTTNDTVVSINTEGVIKAESIGTATITAEYQSVSTNLKYKLNLVVNVNAVDIKIGYGDNERYTLQFKSFEGDPEIVCREDSLSKGGTITAFTVDGENILKSYNQSSKKFVLDKTKAQAINYGANTAHIETENGLVSYTMNLAVCDKMIMTKADLDSINTIAKVSGERYWNGYYMLGADIDYNGTFAGIAPFSSEGSHDVTYDNGNLTGFRGTFDGDGHIINGVIIGDGVTNNTGFFGVLGDGSVVKNVAFVHAKVKGVVQCTGFLAAHAANTTIQDVFVSGIIESDSTSRDMSYSPSLTFGYSRSQNGGAEYGYTMTNVMTIMEAVGEEKAYNGITRKSSMHLTVNSTYSNCFGSHWNTTDFNIPTGVSIGWNSDRFTTKQIDLSKMNNKYWSVQTRNGYDFIMFNGVLPYVNMSNVYIFGNGGAAGANTL